MPRQFKIKIEEHEFIADMMDDVSPKTCQAFWDMLPFDNDAFQVKWSGHAFSVFSVMDLKEAENSRCYGVVPGDILYNPHVHDAAEHPNEVTVVYGPAVMASVSGFAIENLFARIHPESVQELYDLGIEIARTGLKRAYFTRIE